MDKPKIFRGSAECDHRAELEQALVDWHGATVRLEQAHITLRGEICRLTDDLDLKNRELALKNQTAELGEMALGVARVVRDKLAAVSHDVARLNRRTTETEVTEIARRIEQGLGLVQATVEDLLSVAGNREPRFQWVNVRQVVDDVCASLAAKCSAQGVETITDVPAQLGAVVDRDMLRAAMLKLTVNALEAMPRGGRLVVTSCLGPHGLELEVADSGPGLNDEVRARAFEPFFTTKSGAPGLGLTVVHRVAESHGGDVIAINCPEGGAAFTLRFPPREVRAAA
jgi:signal transduction histidine kinase